MCVGSHAGSGEGFDYMHAEDMQREDEAAADAYMAELAESTAPACYLPQLAALIERPGVHRMLKVRDLHACLWQSFLATPASRRAHTTL